MHYKSEHVKHTDWSRVETSAYASGATSRTDLHAEPGRTEPSSLVNAGFQAHTLPDVSNSKSNYVSAIIDIFLAFTQRALCPPQEDNTWEDMPRLGPASHTHDESGDEWYPVAADNGVISRSMVRV